MIVRRRQRSVQVAASRLRRSILERGCFFCRSHGHLSWSTPPRCLKLAIEREDQSLREIGLGIIPIMRVRP